MEIKLTKDLIFQKTKNDKIELLTKLNFWGNEIGDVSIIRYMPQLEIISLSLNKIKTLKWFARMENLIELHLRENLIEDIEEIKYLINCPKLRILSISGNPISKELNYRDIIINKLPQLVKLDDHIITSEERMKAQNKMEDVPQNNNKQNNSNSNNQIESRILKEEKKMESNGLKCILLLLQDLNLEELQIVEKATKEAKCKFNLD